MPYSIKDGSRELLEWSADPCNFYIYKFTIRCFIDDSPLRFIEFKRRGVSDSGNDAYFYPTDASILSYSEVVTDSLIDRTVEILRPRTSERTWDINVWLLNGNIEKIRTTALPYKWNLGSVKVEVSPTNVSTISPVILKTDDEEPLFLNTLHLSFESSIDNVNFGSNTIVGLESGDYTLYVKDNLGCLNQVDFTINADPSQQKPPFIFSSVLNPVYFAKVNELKTNNENQLSYQNTTQTNNKNWTNKYISGQQLRFQYQSSYSENKAYAITENGLSELAVTKLSQNTSLDIRDGFVTYVQGLPMQVYYPESGNVYDEEGNVVGFNTLDGSVLSSNTIGSFITVEGVGTLQIVDLKEDPSLGTLMVLNYNGGGGNIIGTRKITTQIEDLPFEYYEFIFGLTDLGCYQIAICDSNNFEVNNPLNSIKYLSERIELVNEINESHSIEWFNDVNNQIAWSTGIKGKINVPYIMPETFEPEDENEIYSTDTRQALIESDSFENFVFHFDAMPLNIARQLNLLLNSSYVNIDGINYVKKEAIEIDPQFGSNLYVVNAKMSKVTNYNSNSNEGQDISGEPSITVNPGKGILKLN